MQSAQVVTLTSGQQNRFATLEVWIRSCAQHFTIRPVFDTYVHGTEVRFSAACWMVSALAEPT